MTRPLVRHVTGALAVTALAAGCDVSAPFRVIDEERAVERMLVSPDTVVRAAIRDTVRLTAKAIGPAGQEITEATIVWTSGDPSVARSIGEGRFVAVASGRAELFATSRTRRGVAVVVVTR